MELHQNSTVIPNVYLWNASRIPLEHWFKIPAFFLEGGYTTENLSNLSYHQNKYKLITIDLLRKRNWSIPQQINFIGKLQEEDGESMLFVAETQQKFIINFSIDSLNLKE